LTAANEQYWDALSHEYQAVTRIATDNFHYGPLLPGDQELGLLPPLQGGQTALEIGAGAGQNSIYLASLGLRCTALDVSRRQLQHGRELPGADRVCWVQAGMERLPFPLTPTFDLVHSTYALPFAEAPEEVIGAMAALLRPGGHLVLTTGHPLFAAEWLDIDDEGSGMFVRDYYNPPADVRFCEESDAFIAARVQPIGELVSQVAAAGLRIVQVAEPSPLPLPVLSELEIAARMPYHSPEWRELYPLAAAIPLVVVIIAERMSEKASR